MNSKFKQNQKLKSEKQKLVDRVLEEFRFFFINYDIEMIDLEVVDLINRLIDSTEKYVKERDFIEKGTN